MQPHLADITAQLDVAVTALTSLTTESGMAAARAAGWGQGDWLDVVTLCQRVVNQVNAVTDTAMVRAAAYETVVDEHGELAQVDDGDGHVALDAPDLLAAPLGLSRAGTADRLDRAVRLVVGVCPETGEPTGLTGLRPAMLAGGLDGWRARIITDELTGAPADVAAAVIAALGSEPGTRAPGALRRRVRTVLGRVSPDLLRERAEAARRRCGLRRGVAEPGVDEWIGLFPSEQAATAWAAIDTLARDLVTTHDGLSLETARGQALLDLVTSNATIDLTVQVTVPADVLRAAQPGDGDTPPREADDTSADLVQVCFGRPEPALVPRAWITDIAAKQQGRTTLACHPVTGALLDHRESTGYTPSPALAALVRARDGRCRFPDCPIAARFCDLDHVQPWPTGPTTAANLAALCRRHHRIKQRPGWHVVLHPDATMTWTTPTGHTHTTYPLDRLHGITLPATPTEPHTEPHRPEPTRRPPEPAFSRLEYELEHRCPPTTTKHARDLRRLRRHGHTHETIPTPRPGHPHLILTFTTTTDPGPPPF